MNFKIHFLCLLLLFFSFQFASSQQKKELRQLAEKEVPKKVLNKFSEQNAAATQVSWHPYPNQYGPDRSGTFRYYPIRWTTYSPSYYEVRYENNGEKIRKVYDWVGALIVTSRPATTSEAELNTVLNIKGYSGWTVLSVEKVSKPKVGSFLKVWLTREKKRRILFFDEKMDLVKTLRWDNDTRLMVNAEKTPGSNSKKRREPVSKIDVPEVVIKNALENNQDAQVIKWFTYTGNYDPFAADFSYYDVEIPVFYQALLKDKSRTYFNTFTNNGELVESSEIVTLKKLPKPIKDALYSSKFKSWKWDTEHNLIRTADGRVLYRIYGIENDTSRTLIMNEKGVSIKDEF